ncbi:DUF2264 domain-containing protein [Paenibacillus protaetiae]|uniref:DUF2264 domain-containing protein n=1 Tax=Paenibacillus protaetiae TaxID=2509456 RepID=A0A4P6F1Q8_9BACL|nr:DUF2264 domain-containing protein [Paenibacillus protaetiae]QAY68603.1 DUF2264 domain-containing protein [Paenibacillus protaetiae]
MNGKYGYRDAVLTDNPLRTKRDLQQAFEALTAPLRPFYTPGGARLAVGAAGAGFEPAVAGMEGFSRIWWGMVPLLAGGGESPLWELCLQGLANGTDPAHEEYWGDAADYDQRLVEMAAIGFGLALVPERIQEPLTAEQRGHVFRWLNQINGRRVYDCNWLFFRVIVNIGFRAAGLPFDREGMEADLRRIDDFYVEDGWYTDGKGGHSDYYVPFALHFYGLLYAKLMGEEDPARSRLYRDRASRFAEPFMYWFADDGAALPYGRSLTYRFAQSAFWSAAAYAGVEGLEPGVLKGIVLRHLRWWLRQPIRDASGLLTVGYTYPNLVMAENYNSPGSPYWALKAFLPLAFSDDHPFWQAEELPLPALNALSVQRPAHLVLCREQGLPEGQGHAAAFQAGHASTNEHTHTAAKYEKFAYSTQFGFSVPRGDWGLSQGAYDSMLALSESGDSIFRVRRKNEQTAIQGNVLYARWKPWPDVEVQTWIAAGLPWHIRLHRICTGRRLEAAEGGFAVRAEPGMAADVDSGHVPWIAAAASSGGGTSAIRSLLGYETAELVYPQANTNVLHPRTAVPTLRAALEPGVHWLATAIFGSAKGRGAYAAGEFSSAAAAAKAESGANAAVAQSAAGAGAETGAGARAEAGAQHNAAAAEALWVSPCEALDVSIHDDEIVIISSEGEKILIPLKQLQAGQHGFYRNIGHNLP